MIDLIKASKKVDKQINKITKQDFYAFLKKDKQRADPKRNKAKKFLFDVLQHEGHEFVLFANGKLSDGNAIIETVIDAMIKFKNERNKRQV